MPKKSENIADSASPAQVLRRFRIVFNAVRSHFQNVEKQVGLGGAKVWALSVVRDTPGIGVTALANKMDVHQSTASNLVKSLLSKGLIEASKAAEDRRNVQLHISPAGLALLGQAPGPFTGVLPEALRSLQPETLQRLDCDLAELIKRLKADEKAGGIPLAEL